MGKNSIFILIVIGSIAVAGALLDCYVFINSPITPGAVEISHKSKTQNVILIIDDGGGAPQNFKSEFREGINAFDLLKEGAAKFNLNLVTKDYDTGIFVEAIGGIRNGDGGKYWLYYVNGEFPPVAADKKELKEGDKVEFKFEKSPF